jgi:hypothetical protein
VKKGRDEFCESVGSFCRNNNSKNINFLMQGFFCYAGFLNWADTFFTGLGINVEGVLTPAFLAQNILILENSSSRIRCMTTNTLPKFSGLES